jgi:hypothetical protein
MPVKGYWIEPDAVPGIAARNTPFRPDLDRGTADFVDDYLKQMGVPGGYHGRWERLLQELGVEQPVRETVEQVNRVTPEQSNTEPLGQRIVREAVEKHRSDQDKQRFDDLVQGLDWNDETQAFRDSETEHETSQNVPAVLRLTLAAFRGRDAEQLPTRVLLDDLGGTLNATQLGRLMGLCNVSPIENVIWNEKRSRGYARDDIETSIKRGGWPQTAFGWEP